MLTAVRAIGVTRDRRSSGLGILAALSVIVAALGPTLTAIPLNATSDRGALLLVFGLQWLRKAILRTEGRKALHDKAALFTAHAQAPRAETVQRASGLDVQAFTLCSEAVLPEGLLDVDIAFCSSASPGPGTTNVLQPMRFRLLDR